MLKVDHVSHFFGALPVIDDISFRVKEGEIVALIGPSGCGKSTLLNVIAGLQKPEKGTVETNRNAIACIFQDDRLLPWYSVWKNISLVNPVENAKKIQELIHEVGLTGFEAYKPGKLSGGMKKRCGIARAFYYDSRLLLLDEPFQGLDYSLRQEMLQLLLRVWKKHRQAVLFITHEIDEALAVAGRILVLSERPSRIVKEYRLPCYESRQEAEAELMGIRKDILAMITR